MAQEFPSHLLKYQLKSSTEDRQYDPKEEGIKLKPKEPHLLWTLLWMMSWKKFWTTDFCMDYQTQTFRSQVGKPSVLKLCKILSLCLWHVGWFSVWYWWEIGWLLCQILTKKKKGVSWNARTENTDQKASQQFSGWLIHVYFIFLSFIFSLSP